MKQLKKIFAIIFIGMAFGTTMSSMAWAASASVSFSGPATARAGDTITITLGINGSGILGVNGQVKFDASKLSLTGASAAIGSPWVVTINQSAGIVGFVAYDGQQTSPINGFKPLIKMTFTVRSSASAGDSVTLSTQSLQASSGEEAVSIGNKSHRISIQPPLSAENNLSSLVVSNATLSPAFSENVTAYSAGTVPFAVSRLDVKATAKDSNAKISVAGDSLAVGSNTVKITVTAESGATKVYTISVIREQDPNYVKESNTAVASIIIDHFFISPPFDKHTTRYVVWLPYETTGITVSAHPESEKASVAVEGGSNLQEGSNEIKIICTAEDGSVQVYLLVAMRATRDNSDIAVVAPLDDLDPIQNTYFPYKDLMLYALMPILLAGGFGSGYAIKGARKKKIRAKHRDDAEECSVTAHNETGLFAQCTDLPATTEKTSDIATLNASPSAPGLATQVSCRESLVPETDIMESAVPILDIDRTLDYTKTLPATQSLAGTDRINDAAHTKKTIFESRADSTANTENLSREMANQLAEMLNIGNHSLGFDSDKADPAANLPIQKQSETPLDLQPAAETSSDPAQANPAIQPEASVETPTKTSAAESENYSYDAFG